MMILPKGTMNLLLLVSTFASVSLADSLIERSSFGHNARISPTRDAIPGWQLSGEGYVPELLSDRVILTPPYPGHKRGALWTEDTNLQSEWTAQFEFRANGEERGSGNLQLWYVKDGASKVGTSSIYTVGPFDGFALTVDVHGGKGGSIRGFLNDGSTDYKSHTSVDSLAFGHCDYSYRNLGRPSKVQIKQTQSEFEVTVDQKLCFKANKVSLPTGNSFGITAASAENPDSFEIFRFILASIGSNKPVQNQNQNYHRSYDSQQVPAGRDSAQSAGNQNLDAQFSNLQQNIQALSAAVDKLGPELSGKIDNRHQELLRSTPDKNAIASMEQRLQRVENMLSSLQRDMQKMDYSSQFRSLQDALRTSHSGLLENFQMSSNQILSSAPRMGMFIFLIIAFQLALAGSYILYKRRRANMPKKFL